MLNFNPSGHLVANQPIISTLEELHSEFVVDLLPLNVVRYMIHTVESLFRGLKSRMWRC